MAREDARVEVIKDSKNSATCTAERTNTPYRWETDGVVVEPYLTDQWYVACEGLLNTPCSRSRRKNHVHPKYVNTYNRWLENIEDWCIGKLWWGHRIPAWYDRDGGSYVSRQGRSKGALPAAENAAARSRRA